MRLGDIEKLSLTGLRVDYCAGLGGEKDDCDNAAGILETHRLLGALTSSLSAGVVFEKLRISRIPKDMAGYRNS